MQYSNLKNEELLTLYKDLDKNAFNEFFRRNSPILLSFIASRLGNNSEAEEVLQETFFRIHKYVLRYNPDQNAMSWVFAIARNCLLDRVSKRKRHTQITQEIHKHQELESANSNFQKVARDQLEQLLTALSATDRQIIEERYLNETSYDELASKHGVSPASLRQRISRIIRRLRTNQ